LRENRLRGLTSRAVGEKSQKVTRGSHRNDVSPLTQGLRYRAACDNFMLAIVHQRAIQSLALWRFCLESTLYYLFFYLNYFKTMY